MKSAYVTRSLVRALGLTGMFAALCGAAVAGNQTPVCSPTRDVASVMGRGPGLPVQPQCMIERKVSASPAGEHVAEILGRAGAAPRVTAATPAPVTVTINGPKAVETVLGRSGAPAQSGPGLKADAVATQQQ